MNLTHYFVKLESEDVSAAEGTYTFHMVKHYSNLFGLFICFAEKKFPDSEVARKFSSACTMTAAIIKAVPLPHSIDVALRSLK